jgi:hypothetical protein
VEIIALLLCKVDGSSKESKSLNQEFMEKDLDFVEKSK